MKDCVSLEVAQKLQKAGYHQPVEQPANRYVKVLLQDGEYNDEVRTINGHNHLPYAPTATQLAEELPRRCPQCGGLLLITPSFTDKHFFVGYGEHMESGPLPDALGLMMVYLLENGLLTKEIK